MKIELNITGLDALAASIESLAKSMANQMVSGTVTHAAPAETPLTVVQPSEPVDASEKLRELAAISALVEAKDEPEQIDPPAPVEAPKPAKKKKPAPKKEKAPEPEPVVEPEPEIVTDSNNEQAKLDLIVLTKGAMSEATKAGEQEAARASLKSAYAAVDVPNVTKCPLDKVESLAHEITQLLASWIK